MLDWLPIYPARIATAVLLGAAIQPYYASSAVTIPTVAAWKATYPDRIVRKVLPVALRPSFFYPGNDFPALPVPPLSWKAQYPDRLWRKVLPIRPAIFSVPFSRATALTQFPSFPSRIQRNRIHASGQIAIFFKLEGIPPLLSWKGIQPDRIWPLPRLQENKQTAFEFHPDPVPDPPPPGLGYETTSYPAFIHRKASVPLPSRQTFAANLLPIPNPPPSTDFNSPPVYPDWIARPSRRQPQQQPPILTSVPGSDLRWQGTYPAWLTRRLPRPDLRPGVVQAPPAITVIPSALWWRIQTSDPVRRVAGFPAGLGWDPLAWLAIEPNCVEITGEDVTQPFLSEESVTRAVLDEDLTQAGLIDEESCG